MPEQSMQLATCNLQLVACSLQLAACSFQVANECCYYLHAATDVAACGPDVADAVDDGGPVGAAALAVVAPATVYECV